MAAAALPLAIVLGLVAEVVAGLFGLLVRRKKPWARGITAVGSDVLRLLRDKRGSERASVVGLGGAAAAMLGAGIAAAGGLGTGPGDAVLIYLGLGVASAGAWLVAGVGEPAARLPRLLGAAAEPAFAIGLGAMFLRFGSFELDAVRGTQQVLGTGLSLTPGLATAGLVCAAVAFASSGAMRLPSQPEAAGAGAGDRLLARLARWGAIGATALVAAPLLAGGSLVPLVVENVLPVSVAALATAVFIGIAQGLVASLRGVWLAAVPATALIVAAAGAAMVVVA